jgi:hypothetical protein
MRLIIAMCISLASLSACQKDAPDTTNAAPSNSATSKADAQSLDPELEQLKAVKPVDACTLLSPEKLLAIYPKLKFEVHQKLEPRMSGYTWDSRCTYYAGVGSIEFAKDVPTHMVELFVNTVVSETKAQANLASRYDMAKSANGFAAQAELGPHVYAASQTGVVSLFAVKAQSELQINVSDLQSSSAEKTKKLIEVFKAL